MKWVTDESVTNCRKCGNRFGIFTRKHHCRSCGYIFCSLCLNTSKYCRFCIFNPTSFYNLSILFSILPLTLKEYYRLSLVDKTFSTICKPLLRKIYNVFYNQVLNKFTINDSHTYLINQQHLLTTKNIQLNYILKTKCSYYHSIKPIILESHLSFFSIVDILILLFLEPMYIPSCSKFLFTFSTEEWIPFIHVFIYLYGHKNIDFDMKSFILHHIQSTVFINTVFWYLLYYIRNPIYQNTIGKIYNQLLSDILHNVDSDIYQLFLQFNDFSNNLIKQLYLQNDLLKIQTYLEKQPLLMKLPICKNIRVNGIDVTNIQVLQSSNKPVLIPFFTNNNISKHILLKKGVSEKEMIVMKSIQQIDFLLKREKKLDLRITCYDIIPLFRNYGFLEMISHCHTLEYIKNTKKMTIQNFIMQESDITYEEFKDHITKSLAGFCCIQYFLGIGDRHLENILITNNGDIFHIDFEYILGHEPEHVLIKNPIKLTYDMLDAIGNINSDNFQVFLDYCIQSFQCIRKHYVLFYINFINIENLQESTILNFVKERFFLESTEYEACQLFKNCILDNLNNVTSNLVDYLHTYTKKFYK